jgi:hypothetical protein
MASAEDLPWAVAKFDVTVVELILGEPETTCAAGDGVAFAADEPGATSLVPAGVEAGTLLELDWPVFPEFLLAAAADAGAETFDGAGAETFDGAAAELIFGELETAWAAGEGLAFAADELESTCLGPAGVSTVTLLEVDCLELLDSLLAALELELLLEEVLLAFGPGIRRISCIRRQGDRISSAHAALLFNPP